MRALACEWLFTGTELRRSQTLQLAEDGTVIGIADGHHPDAELVQGLVSPAFVNAHCHLELSHLQGHLPRHTGMAGFVRALQPIRDKFDEASKLAAMETAIADMYAAGIAGLGDICNGLSSLPVKQAHPEMLYHNFIEVFGLNPNMAEEIFFKALDLLKAFGRNSSITLHAPYSMSVALRDKILQYAHRREWPQSIHLLESQEERQLFEDLEGPLMEFIQGIGAVFQAHTYSSAAEFVAEALPQNCNILLVHTTEISAQELQMLVEGWPRSFFVLCPSANAYIHNRLPDAQLFAQYPGRICLGTDSLAGNDRLSILAEAQLLQSQFDLPSELLLRWATLNGALALGFGPSRFSIQAGSRPILIHMPQFDGQLNSMPAEPTIQYLST